MKLSKKHENRIEVITDTPTSLANVIRRYGMSRVPVLAIDTVTFYDNTSAFWDEYLGHRIGLLPVLTPDKLPEGAEVNFSLDSEGPKTVYASDMVSSDKEISIAKGNIVIATLGANQRIRFEAKATVGIGRKHAKFQAGLLSYGVEGNGIKFVVESFFQMEPVDVVSRACDVIESDIEAIEAALGSEKPKKKAVKKAKKEKKEKEE